MACTRTWCLPLSVLWMILWWRVAVVVSLYKYYIVHCSLSVTQNVWEGDFCFTWFVIIIWLKKSISMMMMNDHMMEAIQFLKKFFKYRPVVEMVSVQHNQIYIMCLVRLSETHWLPWLPVMSHPGCHGYVSSWETVQYVAGLRLRKELSMMHTMYNNTDRWQHPNRRNLMLGLLK
jgi:hypothetical protein